MKPIQTLLAVPLSVELKQVLSLFHEMQCDVQKHEVGGRSLWEVSGFHLLLVQGGHGKVELALRCQYWLDQFQGVERLILLGSAGALGPDLLPGDVVVANAAYEHDFKSAIFSHKPLHTCGPLDFDKLTSIAGPELRIFHGPIASGDEDVLSRERARSLHQESGALAVAWEGAGAARVATFNSIPFYEIRGITDHADPAAAESFKKNLPLALKNAVLVLRALLRDA